MGVCHTSDMLPAFGHPFLMPIDYIDREKDISVKMMDSFISFIRTGNPGVMDGAQWPHYYTMGDNIVEPYYEYTNTSKAATNFYFGLKHYECNYLWNKHNF
ncbi:unnamed protein product, partial [Medioppia subpectinata]